MRRNRIEGWRLRPFLIVLALACLGGSPFAWTQKPPAQAGSPLAVAGTRLARGELQGAESALWSLLSSDPNNAEALTLLGIVRGRQQRYQEAEALFRRVLQLNPKSVAAHRNLASALIARDKLDEAIEHYQQAEQLAPQDSTLKLELARLLVGRGRFAEALSTLYTIPRGRFPAAAIPVKAASLLGVGQKSEAAALSARAKDSPEIALDLAEVFLEGNLPGEALKSLNLAAGNLQRPSSRFYFLKGRALTAQGQPSAALTNFRQALALDPKSTDTLLGMAEVYAMQNQHADSTTMLERAHALSSGALPVLRRLAVEAIKAGQHDIALEAANELAEKSTDNLDDRYLAAAAMVAERAYPSAVPILEQYVAQRPQDTKAWFGLGLAYVNLQRYPDARRALERSSTLDPNLAEAEYQLGIVAGKEGKPQEAIQHFEHLVQQQPHHAKALASLGAVYLQSGEMEKAQDALQRSEAADPSEPDTEYQLSLLFNRTGKPEEARRHMERFRKLKEERDRSPGRSREEQPKIM
jgi:tetratricopeptide (TPR) repeat protein